MREIHCDRACCHTIKASCQLIVLSIENIQIAVVTLSEPSSSSHMIHSIHSRGPLLKLLEDGY